MTPVMTEIGYLWSEGKLSIATEHVASNVAQTLVKIIMDQVSGSGNKKKIMISVYSLFVFFASLPAQNTQVVFFWQCWSVQL